MNVIHIPIDEIDVNILLSGILADVLQDFETDVVVEERRTILG
jgi:hypothetical protein